MDVSRGKSRDETSVAVSDAQSGGSRQSEPGGTQSGLHQHSVNVRYSVLSLNAVLNLLRDTEQVLVRESSENFESHARTFASGRSVTNAYGDRFPRDSLSISSRDRRLSL